MDENGEFKEQKFIKMPVNSIDRSSTSNPHVSELKIPKTSTIEKESPDGPIVCKEIYHEVSLNENFSSPNKNAAQSNELA